MNLDETNGSAVAFPPTKYKWKAIRMAIINRMAEFQADISAWRRDIHAHPELQYELHRTADKVAGLLRDFGCDEVVTGVGKTGVVGVIRGKQNASGRAVALRADMDALPIHEETDKPWASTIPGRMHACGHDGHTAMLLGAARYLAETRNFDGAVVLVFQPAEEGGAGAKAMIDDGLFSRWPAEAIYGLHNFPGVDVGDFAIRSGPLMASADTLKITINGQGGHAAMPHNTIDPVMIAMQIVNAYQTVIARNLDPVDTAVISITKIDAGTTDNVIPPKAVMSGTVRALVPETRAWLEERTRSIATSIAAMHGASADFSYIHGYPPTVNHEQETEFAATIGDEIVGRDRVDRDRKPTMGAEDFSFYLKEKPGAFIFMGNGDTAGLHHPGYDFNDEAIPYGCSFFARLAERALPL